MIYFLDNRGFRYSCVEFPAKPSPAAIVGAPRMKVQYLGDVNDYRKYALLRLLARSGLKIGINWLLTSDDGRRDGNKRGYLAQPERWGACDPELFAFLRKVRGAPTIDDLKQIEEQDIVPGAAYFREPVPCGRTAREAFHEASMQVLGACDLVFFDPDNGLAPASVRKTQSVAIKFVFDDELAAHYAEGRSLLVYQHFPRVERSGFIKRTCSRIQSFAPHAGIWACYTSNVLFILASNLHSSTVRNGSVPTIIEEGRNRWPDKFIKFANFNPM